MIILVLAINFIKKLRLSLDSLDIWCDSKQFPLNHILEPVSVAACLPDGFLAGGLLWGNPLFD